MFSTMYKAKMSSSTRAPIIEKEPLSEKAKSAATAASSRAALGAKSLRLTAMGIKIMLMAKIMAVLQMTEPMPLPMAMPTLSCEAAM